MSMTHTKFSNKVKLNNNDRINSKLSLYTKDMLLTELDLLKQWSKQSFTVCMQSVETPKTDY